MTATILPLRPGDPQWLLLLWEREKGDAARRKNGKACLEIMKDQARVRFEDSKGGKLSIKDRVKIASALHVEVEKLEKDPNQWEEKFSKRALVLKAELASDTDTNPTKRFNTYARDCYSGTFEENAERRRKLSANPLDYARLIEALLKFCDEKEHDAICERIFSGTSFQGTEVDINQHRRLAKILQDKADSVDRMLAMFGGEETLEQVFSRTAAAKQKIQESGSVTNWPYIELSEPYDETDGELPNWQEPYWQKKNTAGLLDASPEAVYSDMFAASLDWYDAILHLPRMYLGCAVYFPVWLDEEAPTSIKRSQYLAEINQTSSELAELRTLENGKLSMAWQAEDDDTYSRSGTNRSNDPITKALRLLEGEGHCWLAVYPSPDGKGVCPIFYWSQGEGGVHVSVVSASSMHIFSRIHVSSGSSKKIVTVFERIDELLSDGGQRLEI